MAIKVAHTLTPLFLGSLSTIDFNGNFQSISDSLSQVLGYTSKELKDKKFIDLVIDFDQDKTTAWLNSISTNKEVVGSPFYNYCKHKDESLILLAWTAYKREGENLIYLSSALLKSESYDFTEVKSLTQTHSILTLLESVITYVSDAVVITEAESVSTQGVRIVYVNDAFSKMTGYTPAEAIGQSPRFLHGPLTDQDTINLLRESLKKWEPCEITVVNYKKNGKAFWNNIKVRPVANGEGKFTHWIGLEKDVTDYKVEEFKKTILAELSQIFNQKHKLIVTLPEILRHIIKVSDVNLGELWLVTPKKESIQLRCTFYKNAAGEVYSIENTQPKSFLFGEGISGSVWSSGKILISEDVESYLWNPIHSNTGKFRSETIVALPLLYSTIGVMVLGLDKLAHESIYYQSFFYELNSFLEAQLNRRYLEEEVNLLLNSAPVIICLVSFDGWFKRVNSAASHYLSYSEDELLSQPIFQIIHPDDHSIVAQEITSLQQGDYNTQDFEVRLIAKNGEVKIFSWTATKLQEEELILAIGKDVTEQKKLQTLLDNASELAKVGSWEIDLVTGSIYWSKMVYEIHEVTPQFIPSMENSLTFYQEDYRDMALEVFTKGLQTGTNFDFEAPIITATGKKTWVRTIGTCEYNEQKIVKIRGSFQDIHERKMAQIELQQSYEEKNMILDSIGDGFFSIDKNWIVNYWNKQAETILGIKKGDIVGKNLISIFDYMENAPLHIQFQKAIAENLTYTSEDFYPRINKWIEISCYPSEKGLSAYFKDITTRKQSEFNLQQLNQTLEQQAKELAVSNAELEQFAYVASHDLQEPLRMVTSFLSQLERKYGSSLDDKAKQYIYFAVDGAKRMRQIILDLLDFSRVGKNLGQREEVPISHLIEEIIQLQKQSIEETQAVIVYGDLPTIVGYKVPLMQVFHNLISNALKYHQKGVSPRVKIEATEENEYWLFSIKDNGIGIEEAYFDKIFILFQRLHGREQYNGTGIGLALVKKIIENEGGRIWVQSTLGQGSTFYFTLLKQTL
ncbi:PAS domain S-box protein [Runella sp. MFBS21]|uniref:PAS domain S-box protein n=1 Tax=Runella sp. MFBS21 TaxID=3034018 RepID=UPI0023F82942|nr:PAS domain S-box protein [Runella sp. MFBS21]MDF7817971.1 PAS domain S-box protein [Runella sp. MFBS21]